MKPVASPKLLARLAWRLRSRSPIRHLKIRACYASGFGLARSGQCAKSLIGPVVHSGRRDSNDRKMRNLYPTVLIGTCGLLPRPNAHSTGQTDRLSSADGTTSADGRQVIWDST